MTLVISTTGYLKEYIVTKELHKSNIFSKYL